MNSETNENQADTIVLTNVLQRTSCRDSILVTQHIASKTITRTINTNCGRTWRIEEDEVATGTECRWRTGSGTSRLLCPNFTCGFIVEEATPIPNLDKEHAFFRQAPAHLAWEEPRFGNQNAYANNLLSLRPSAGGGQKGIINNTCWFPNLRSSGVKPGGAACWVIQPAKAVLRRNRKPACARSILSKSPTALVDRLTGVRIGLSHLCRLAYRCSSRPGRFRPCHK